MTEEFILTINYKSLQKDYKARLLLQGYTHKFLVKSNMGYAPKEIQGTWQQVESRPVETKDEIDIEGRKLELINISKELWHGLIKGDLLDYYIKIAPFILPYLKDRPLALHINLHGPYGDSFFLRGLEGHYASWAEVFVTKRKHPKKGKSENIEWLVCNDLATLVYMINLECIDVHPWNSRIISPNEPDYIVIDLDPSDDDFQKAVDTAKAAKKFFDQHKITSFVKTSGKTGIHLFLPCTGIEYGAVRTIAENICDSIHEMVPELTTMVVSKSSRGSKLYVDPSQNDYADRVAVAYCTRANDHPTVSTPLDWRDVNNKLHPTQFTIQNIHERLEKKGDLWKNLLDNKIRQKNSGILQSFL